jgi:hypothetical protein
MQPEITISLQHLAIATALIVGFAFLLGLHPFKKKKRLVVSDLVTSTQKNTFAELWTAGDYFMYLNALLKASQTPDELKRAMVYVENYKERKFRVPISGADLNDYYNRLIDSYTQKELEFDCTKMELCKN